ncbi:MAG: hypothetical protein HUJ63_00350, partial [Enterococcus sp.]|nr:hypothetical protein [Enterococcus sp.]
MFKKTLTWLTIFSTLLNPTVGNICAFAETIDDSSQTEEVSKEKVSESNEKENPETKEMTEETTISSEQNSQDNLQTTDTTNESVSNDSPKVVTKEVPKELEKYFISMKDIQNATSFSEQEKLAKESEDWQAILRENILTRGTRGAYTLVENGRK